MMAGLPVLLAAAIHTLEPDFPPVHQFAPRAVTQLALAKALVAELLVVSKVLQSHRIGKLPHRAGPLVDEPIDTIANLRHAPAASRHFQADAHASVTTFLVQRLQDLTATLDPDDFTGLQT
jgi:hypothetical protein